MEYRLFIRYTKVATHQFTLFDSYNKKTDTTDIVESTSSLTRISSAEAQQNTIATAACVAIHFTQPEADSQWLYWHYDLPY